MAMSVTYTNFLGGIAAEMRGGVGSYYVSDTLGSTAALVNSSGTVTDTWTYWPYGEVQARTGTTATPFTFVGILGYFQDLLNNFTYVRARYLRVGLAKWQTVDPLWPRQQAFGYVHQMPINLGDPSGLMSPGDIRLCFEEALEAGLFTCASAWESATFACKLCLDAAAANCVVDPEGCVAGYGGCNLICSSGLVGCILAGLLGFLGQFLTCLKDKTGGEPPQGPNCPDKCSIFRINTKAHRECIQNCDCNFRMQRTE